MDRRDDAPTYNKVFAMLLRQAQHRSPQYFKERQGLKMVLVVIALPLSGELYIYECGHMMQLRSGQPGGKSRAMNAVWVLIVERKGLEGRVNGVDQWFTSSPVEWFATSLGPIWQDKAGWEGKLRINVHKQEDVTNYVPAPFPARTIAASTDACTDNISLTAVYANGNAANVVGVDNAFYAIPVDALSPLQVTIITGSAGSATAVLSDVLPISFATGTDGSSLGTSSDFGVIFCLGEDDQPRIA
ncbi:hypothetical protein DFH09DRAFT_1084905 [Mycena vulgaris]|nr:hypothetical protein DFH09DRAFT_1084905 [Mycena vulgaris]